MFVKMAWTCAALAAVFAGTATAADEAPFFFRGGPAYANFDASAHVKVAGTLVAGGDASVSSNTGAEFELGYMLDPRWAVTLAVGIPPRARFFGAGTLTSAGKLGEATYGPTVLALLYFPETNSNLHPYIGGGANYTFIFQTDDSALTHLKVNNAFGEALQFGAEYSLSRRTAIFFDMKKIWLKTDASGFVQTSGGMLPASARVELDPIILNTGLSFHF